MFSAIAQQFTKSRWSVFLVAIAICLVGLYNLESAARSSMPGLYVTQAAWMGFGLLIALVLGIIDYRIIRRFAYPSYIGVCTLLVLVLLLGRVVSGSKRWIYLGFFNLQPSEWMKVAIIMTLASYFASRPSNQKFTIRSLIRPLNISRPLLALAVIGVKWDAPFLTDTIGFIARFLHQQREGMAPPVPDVLWFRIGLLVAMTLLFAVGVWLIMASSARQAADLLGSPDAQHPKLKIALASLLYVVLVALIFWLWDKPIMLHPINAIMRYLIVEASPGGSLHTPATGYATRIFLLAAAGFYLLVAILALRFAPWRGFDSLVAPLDIMAFPALLIIVEPDLGTTLIVLAIAGSMLLYVGIRPLSLVIMAFTLVVGSGLAWGTVLRDYQKRRIISVLDPEKYAKGSGYHSIQSMIAVGSGQVWGKGHGKGTQTQLRFLPEQHTDFAFSVWAEEAGFAGCLFLILLYAALVLLLLLIAAKCPEMYGSLLCVGTAALIFWHMVVNIGMVLGVLPVVGLTLPLFSYGGSSLITMLAAIGMAVGVSAPVRTFKQDRSLQAM